MSKLDNVMYKVLYMIRAFWAQHLGGYPRKDPELAEGIIYLLHLRITQEKLEIIGRKRSDYTPLAANAA